MDEDGLWGPPLPISGFIEPLEWGRSHYTILRVPALLVEAAASVGTSRVAGEIEDLHINLGVVTAPQIDGHFVWTGAALLRRMQVEEGDPVSGWLAPVDPQLVPLSPDVAAAVDESGAREAWEALRPAVRRQRLVAVDAAVRPETRRRRIAAMIAGLSDGSAAG